MEDRAILELNLDRYRRLLEGETDPGKRRTLIALIRETEEQLRHRQTPQAPAADRS